MTNTFYRKGNGRILILVLVIVLVAIGNFFKGEIRNIFYTLSSPIQIFLRETAGNVFSSDLARENKSLRAENLRLMGGLAELNELKTENEILRQALSLGLDKEFKLLFAQISAGFSGDILLLNKGAEDGVKTTMPVISEQKVLYGFVKDVYGNYSTVLLLSHPESSVNVRITNGDIDGEVRGEGGSAVLDLIPQDADLKEGELIVTRSFAGKYPERLLVGFLGEVRASDVSPFKTAKVELFSASIPERLFIVTDF